MGIFSHAEVYEENPNIWQPNCREDKMQNQQKKAQLYLKRKFNIFSHLMRQYHAVLFCIQHMGLNFFGHHKIFVWSSFKQFHRVTNGTQYTLFLRPTCTHTHTHTHKHIFSLALTLTHLHTQIYTHTLSLSLSLSLTIFL